MSKKWYSIIGAGALALALIGCGGGASGGDTSAEAPAGGGEGGGTMAMITVDIANPYWKASAETAQKVGAELGYTVTVDAHLNKPDAQNQYIDGAISKKVDAIILDPAGAEESIGAVQKATDAGIPVFLVNAEITEQGIAKSQIISNNAQGATLGAEEWVKAVNYQGEYVELFGQPTDNNSRVRSDAYHAVIDQYPDLKLLQTEVANWDRVQGKTKMEILLAAHPNIVGVISGNDEMALGAIEAIRAVGKLDQIKVLGFDGNQDAVNAVKAGDMVATVLQPIVEGTTLAVQQADNYLKTGETGAASEKQSIDCVLITPENADQFNNFVQTK